MTRRTLVLTPAALLTAILAVSGCGTSHQPREAAVDSGAKAGSSTSVKPSAAATAGAPSASASKAETLKTASSNAELSEAEGRQFTDSFLKAVNSGELKQVNEQIDWPAVLDRATAGIEQAKPLLRTQFKERAVRQAEDPDRSFAAKLSKTIKDGGKLQPLRIHEVDGAPAALFRLSRKDGSIGYLDFVLGHNAKGETKTIDVDAAQDGQLLSATIREAYLQLLAAEQPKLLDSLAGSDRVFFESAPQLERISALRRSGNFKQAMETFEQLPPAARSRANFQRLHAAIAEGLGDKPYAEALDEFAARYPDDPSQNLLSADFDLRMKRFDKAAICIQRLDQYVDDPYLDVLLARLYLQAGNAPAARHAADQAIKRAPRELDGYEARLSVSLEEKRFADTARLLHFIGTHFGAKFRDLNKLPAYEEFVKSPEYTDWQKAESTPQQVNNK